MSTKKKSKKDTTGPLKLKPAGRKGSTVEFVSFSFGATIPTQAFGNVGPRIEVKAGTYEEARDFAIPRIEELYANYAEIKPVFMGRITVEEKVVSAPAPASPAGAAISPSAKDDQATASASPVPPKSEPVQKAEKAIALAATIDAVDVIQTQIMNSTKIAPEDKPALYTICLKRKKELETL